MTAPDRDPLAECPICGPDYTHGEHVDDSYGACVVCREYVPHTDDETTAVAFPCAPVRLRAALAPRPPETADPCPCGRGERGHAPVRERETADAGALDARGVPAGSPEAVADLERRYPQTVAAIRDATSGLDVAWAEAEARLPKGWTLEVGDWRAEPNRPEGVAPFEAIAEPYVKRRDGSDPMVIGRSHDSPADALHELAMGLYAAESPTPEPK